MRSSSSAAVKLVAIGCLALGAASTRPAHAARSAFAYVNANPDKLPNAVSAFHVGVDGLSTAVPGSPYLSNGFGLSSASGAEHAHRIEVSRSRDLLFVANDGSGSISTFNVNPFDGTLSPAPGSPFLPENWAAFSGISLAASNDGRFLYASGTTVLSLAVAADGSLSELGSEWEFPGRVAGLAVRGDNSQLFLSTPTTVYILSSGEFGLTADTPTTLSVGSTATDLRLDTSGTRLWVGTQYGGVLGYSLSGGTIDIAPGAPFFSAVSSLSGLSVDFYGRFLIAYSAVGPRLLGAQTNSDASLVLANNSPIEPVLAPTSGALIPDGSLLLLTDGRAQLDAWSTSNNGSLSHSAGYPVPTNAPAGFASVVSFPDKTPTPAPASPYWLTLLLATALGLLGAQSALQPLAPRD